MSFEVIFRKSKFLLMMVALYFYAPSSFAQTSSAADNEDWTPFKLSLIPKKFEFPQKQNINGLRLGIASTSDDNINGIDCGLYLESTKVKGVQLDFIGGTSKLNGVSLGGVDISGQVDGIQANLIGNWAFNSLRGAQIGAMNVATETRGAQIGAWNMGDIQSGAQLGIVNIDLTDKSGALSNPSSDQDQQDRKHYLFQVGVINYTRAEPKGFQIGIINLAESLHGLQIGVINYIRVHKTLPFSFSPILNFSF